VTKMTGLDRALDLVTVRVQDDLARNPDPDHEIVTVEEIDQDHAIEMAAIEIGAEIGPEIVVEVDHGPIQDPERIEIEIVVTSANTMILKREEMAIRATRNRGSKITARVAVTTTRTLWTT